jgi:hypothetical protein
MRWLNIVARQGYMSQIALSRSDFNSNANRSVGNRRTDLRLPSLLVHAGRCRMRQRLGKSHPLRNVHGTPAGARMGGTTAEPGAEPSFRVATLPPPTQTIAPNADSSRGDGWRSRSNVGFRPIPAPQRECVVSRQRTSCRRGAFVQNGWVLIGPVLKQARRVADIQMELACRTATQSSRHSMP